MSSSFLMSAWVSCSWEISDSTVMALVLLSDFNVFTVLHSGHTHEHMSGVCEQVFHFAADQRLALIKSIFHPSLPWDATNKSLLDLYPASILLFMLLMNGNKYEFILLYACPFMDMYNLHLWLAWAYLANKNTGWLLEGDVQINTRSLFGRSGSHESKIQL